MKKILLPIAALLCACSSAPTAPASTAASEAAATDSIAAAPAEEPASEVDAASGATSVPNEPTFNGILVLPPQSRATVTLTMGGSIRSTTLLPGAYVKQGTVLATLENPEFIALQQSYLDSHAQYEFLRTEFLRQQTLAREEASSQKHFQQSKAEYLSMRSRMDAAAAQLALLGVDTTRLLAGGIIPYLDIKAPISGYAADVKMNIGRHFDVGEPLCEIVNKSDMMLRLTAYEKDLANLRAGDRVEFRVNGIEGETFHGVITMVGQQVNNENRSIDVYVRIEGQNPQFPPGNVRHGAHRAEIMLFLHHESLRSVQEPLSALHAPGLGRGGRADTLSRGAVALGQLRTGAALHGDGAQGCLQRDTLHLHLAAAALRLQCAHLPLQLAAGAGDRVVRRCSRSC